MRANVGKRVLELAKMSWSEGKRAGLMLGAVLWDDRTLQRVAPHFAPPLLAQIAEQFADLGHSDRATKTRSLRELAARVRGDLGTDATHLPPRARVLLARLVPREQGRAWLEGAPPPQPDYVSPRDLIATLIHLACAQDHNHAETHPSR